MMLKTHRLAALAAVLVAGAVTPAHAVQVTYSTSGTFGSSGTALLSQGGARIQFDPFTTTLDDPLSTNALFGSFKTLAAPASPGVTLVDTFTLKITQTSPSPGGELVFTSNVGGRIILNNSQAYIEFDGELEKSLSSGGITTTYRVGGGGASSPGRLGLFGGEGQASTLLGQVSAEEDLGIVSTPEPGTMAMACIALPVLGLGYVRNRRRRAKV